MKRNKKKKEGKLSFTTETLRRLDADSLKRAAGAVAIDEDFAGSFWPISCACQTAYTQAQQCVFTC